MRDWLIKKLGGYTEKEWETNNALQNLMQHQLNRETRARLRLSRECEALKRELEEVKNNGKDKEGTA